VVVVVRAAVAVDVVLPVEVTTAASALTVTEAPETVPLVGETQTGPILAQSCHWTLTGPMTSALAPIGTRYLQVSNAQFRI
jgi:hypothetical protein